jgi:hypothetical protein
MLRWLLLRSLLRVDLRVSFGKKSVLHAMKFGMTGKYSTTEEATGCLDCGAGKYLAPSGNDEVLCEVGAAGNSSGSAKADSCTVLPEEV